jgi:hypothetical protein
MTAMRGFCMQRRMLPNKPDMSKLYTEAFLPK